MTSSDVTASSRPTASRARRRLRALFAVLPLALAILAMTAMPVIAQAAEPTSSETETGYGKEPEKPEEKEAAPKEEEKEAEPTGEVEPAEEEAAVEPTTATTLPFTGLDLRWVVGVGLVMVIAGGGTLVVMRRRERDESGR